MKLFVEFFKGFIKEKEYERKQGQRENLSSRLCTECGAQWGSLSQDPEIMTWAKIQSWLLNQRSQPGAPKALCCLDLGHSAPWVLCPNRAGLCSANCQFCSSLGLRTTELYSFQVFSSALFGQMGLKDTIHCRVMFQCPWLGRMGRGCSRLPLVSQIGFLVRSRWELPWPWLWLNPPACVKRENLHTWHWLCFGGDRFHLPTSWLKCLVGLWLSTLPGLRQTGLQSQQNSLFEDPYQTDLHHWVLWSECNPDWFCRWAQLLVKITTQSAKICVLVVASPLLLLPPPSSSHLSPPPTRTTSSLLESDSQGLVPDSPAIPVVRDQSRSFP